MRFIFLLLPLISSVFAQTTVTVGLEWFLNPHHALFVIGQKKGIFEKYGLCVNLVPAGGSQEGCKLAAANRLNFAITNEAQVLIQRHKGLDLRFVSTFIPIPLEVMVSRIPIQELKGKKIGHASSGVGFSKAALQRVFQHHGQDADLCELVYLNQGLLTAFVAGTVDALQNVYSTYGVVDLQQYIKDFYIYPYEENGVPSFAGMILVASSSTSDDICAKMVLALKETALFLKTTSSADTWKLFIANHPEQNTPLNEKVWERLTQLFKIDDSAPKNQKLEAFLRENGLIS